MNANLIKEPILQFGSGEFICPKRGIEIYNPYDIGKVRPEKIITGIIGKSESINKIVTWLEICKKPIAAKTSKQPNLFTSFPGFNKEIAFKCELIYDDTYLRKINNSTVEEAIKNSETIEETIENVVELYLTEIKFLSKNKRPDVLLCVMDEQLFNIIFTSSVGKIENSKITDNKLKEQIELNFRRLLKAKSMSYNIPIQLMRDRINDNKRDMQDPATIAWNFFIALYYKAGGIPWALNRSDSLMTCFGGVSFYKSRNKKSTQTSVTQIFNEHGKGVILRGGEVQISKKDREPHLSDEQAYNLLKNSLTEYYEALKVYPQRLVLHKSSNYSSDEISGFKKAATEKNVSALDLVTIMPSSINIYKETNYPPKRGTIFSFNNKRHFLYSRGFVDYFDTYPGKYIPNPIEVRLFSYDEDPVKICKEILSLTKMNWNNSQFDRKFPITIECSRKVGEIIKYLDKDVSPQLKYSFYM